MFFRKRPKVFCIGRNKTGTTSLAVALRFLGYRVAPQGPAELLTEDWARRDFRRLVRFCRRHEAFQDIPFSLDFTFVALDQAYPGSKFILSVRDSAEQWFDSFVRFQTQLLGLDHPPTAQDLAAFEYRREARRRGELWRRHQLIYGADEKHLYDPALYQNHYERHNDDIRLYFRHRPADLLELNLARPDSMERLCRFLEVPYSGQPMPRENVSRVPLDTSARPASAASAPQPAGTNSR
jgi:hypothetical protein